MKKFSIDSVDVFGLFIYFPLLIILTVLGEVDIWVAVLLFLSTIHISLEFK